jgi:hypothetical protein
MADNDIRKELASWTDFTQKWKKDISSGQIRNYVNVLNALKWLGKIIRSLEDVLNKKDNEIVRRKSDEIKNSIEKLQDIVSDSISKPDSYIKVTNRLDDLIDNSNKLSELLAEEQRTGEQKKGTGTNKGQKDNAKLFTFNNAQAFYKGKDLNLPSSKPVKVLEKLAGSFGQAICHKDLDSQSTNSNACDSLRENIAKIRDTLKREHIPFKIESRRGFGYVLSKSR